MDNDKSKVKIELIKHQLGEARKHYNLSKDSMRWKLGDSIISVIDKLLFRSKSKLSFERLDEHLNVIDEILTSNTDNEIRHKNKFVDIRSHFSIGIIVTETSIHKSHYGDTFVANNLVESLRKIYPNVKASLISTDQNRDLNQFDVILNMLWNTQIDLRNNSKTLLIGWIRNYPENWLSNSSVVRYDFYLASSKKIYEYIKETTNKPCLFFPIAGNVIDATRTLPKDDCRPMVFVGNKFKEERFVEKLIKAKIFEIDVYGKGWDKYSYANKGFVSYDKLPKIYQNYKFVLDSANDTTKLWASLNSRVFEAIASKRLPITDSLEAAELFDESIPMYKNISDLKQVVKSFSKENNYRNKLKKLEEELFYKHSYDVRANQLLLSLTEKIKITLKISASVKNKKLFGDYYFAQSLKKKLEIYGHTVEIDCLDNWYDGKSSDSDLIIAIQGLHSYKPIEGQKSFCWLISHPDSVKGDDLIQYSKVFVPSQKLIDSTKVLSIENSFLLPQCTDTDLFFPLDIERRGKIVFVGNSRGIFRRCIQYAIELNLEFDLYGSGWNDLIDSKYIKGEFIPNDKLVEIYNSYDIVLNDHWDDMLEQGIVSNRFYDVMACRSILVTDWPDGLDKPEYANVFLYQDMSSFKEAINQAEKLADNSKSDHYNNIHLKDTFSARAEQILLAYFYD